MCRIIVLCCFINYFIVNKFLLVYWKLGKYVIELKNNVTFIFRCVICMMEFLVGDNVRYLPCMHIYHVHCIDDWLMRSFTCPSCMEPVDAALLTSYETS